MMLSKGILYQVIARDMKTAQRLSQAIGILMNGQAFLQIHLLGTAALDRLVHKGIQVIIEGYSYRLAEFKKSLCKIIKKCNYKCY